MKRTKILLIDQQGELNKYFIKQKLSQCKIIQCSLRESDILMHLDKKSICILSVEKLSEKTIALIKAIRLTRRNVPVIAITTEPGSHEVVEAYRAGLTDYFFLPMNDKKFTALLQCICKKTGYQQDNQSAANRMSSLQNKLINNVNCFRRKMAVVLKKQRRKRHRKTNLLQAFAKVWRSFSSLKIDLAPRSDLAVLNTPNQAQFALSGSGMISFPADLEVVSLGDLRVKYKQRKIESWPSRKGRGIFAYIATSGQRIYRDVLMEKFWPDTGSDSARNSLNVALHGLRKTFNQVDTRQECIIYKDECYYLNPNLNYYCDTHIFRTLYNEALALENRQKIEQAISKYRSAMSIYHGDFMQDDLYEEWPTLERENLREKYFNILERLSSYYIESKKFRDAIQLCEQILARDGCREDVHRKLMICQYFSGQRDKALRQFIRCQRTMKEDLGVLPSKVTFDLNDKIRSEQLLL